MSIHIDSCAASDTIVVKTRSSVYELILLSSEWGEVLVRGGRHFTEFCRVWFVGSTADGGAVERHSIDIGLRMKFYFGDRVIVTSAVQSLSRGSASASNGVCSGPMRR
jgi:hypothetical protein